MDTLTDRGRKHTVNLRVNDEELDFLRRVADEEDRSISSVLRLALRVLVEERSREDVTA